MVMQCNLNNSPALSHVTNDEMILDESLWKTFWSRIKSQMFDTFSSSCFIRVHRTSLEISISIILLNFKGIHYKFEKTNKGRW